jgi:hypothetical protein
MQTFLKETWPFPQGAQASPLGTQHKNEFIQHEYENDEST